MNQEPPSSHEDLFALAASLPQYQRQEFLAQQCAGHPEVKAELESLLRAHDAAEGFLDGPVAAAGEFSDELIWDETETPIPERIGKYSIQSILGAGGMGTVYLARQEGTSRDVALKVMRPGYASASSRRRFEHEARTLALLHHPCIAQIYEAGIAEIGGGPQPFFAMELVHGQALNTYAEEAGLSVDDRLELVALVCDAVEHAHSRGVIHRDLKPANILVDASGSPRVLDFGVARATSSDHQVSTLHTMPGQLIGTLAYMSPEQIAGDPADVDGRCDVYALGIILYELLAGRPPHDSKATPLPEMLRRIREQDASPLGTLNDSFRGDIETIVGKALEKEPQRRYPSAQALADDIRRYLRHETILARRPTLIEQSRKFTRRNRALVGAAGAVFTALVLLVVGVSVSLMHAREAERVAVSESEKASIEAAHARAVSRFLQDMLSGVDPAVAKSADTTLLRSILDVAATRADDLADMPEVEATVRHVIGGTYLFAGLHAPAEHHLSRAFSLRQASRGADNASTLETANRMAVLRHQQGRFDEAEQLYKEVLRARRETLGNANGLTLESVNNLGALYLELDRRSEAEPLCIEAAEGRRRLLGEDDRWTLESVANLGGLYWRQGRYEELAPVWERVLEARLRIDGPDHPRTLTAMSNLALLYGETGRRAEAEEMFRTVIEARRQMAGGAEHPEMLRAMINLAQLLHTDEDIAKVEEVEALYIQLMELHPRVLGEDHLQTLNLLNNLASHHLSQGRPEQAEALLDRIVTSARTSLPAGSTHLASFVAGRGITRAALKRYADAEADLLESYTMLEGILGHGELGLAGMKGDGRVIWTMQMLVQVYLASGRPDEAALWQERLLQITEP